MIEKKVLIEFLQVQLEGGDAPVDVRGRYHPLTIQRAVDLVFSDMVNVDTNIASAMALDFDVTVDTNGSEYTSTLPSVTIGPAGIFAVKSGGDEFYPTDPQEFLVMRRINPNSKLVKVTGAKKLTYSKKPQLTTAVVTMVPRFSAMGPNDAVILEGYESKLFEAVYKMMQSTPHQFDKINNSRIDG